MLGDTLTTRDAVRRAALDDLITRCELASVAQEGGPLDGVQVVSIGRIRDEVTAALLVDLPPASDQYAEVVTPAQVAVSAICPECRLPVDVLVKLGTRLTVEGNSTELNVKAKSKAVPHLHGQQTLTPPVEGQEDFGLDDIVGEVPTVEVLETALMLVLPDDLAAAVPALIEIEAWSDLEKRAVADWAVAVHLVASDNDDVTIPERPAVIGGTWQADAPADDDDEPEADAGTPVESPPDDPDGDAPAEALLPDEPPAKSKRGRKAVAP